MPDAPHRHSTFWPAVLGTIAIAALCITIFIATLLPRPTPQPAPQSSSVRDQVISLKSSAEQLAIEGKLSEAHLKYREIEQLAAGVKEPALWELAERAKHDQDRIYGLILSRMEADTALKNALAQRESALAKSLESRTPQIHSQPEPETKPLVVTPTTRSVISTIIPPKPHPSPTTRLTFRKPPAIDSSLDARIGQAIDKGATFLANQFTADQLSLDDRPLDTFSEGMNALAVYALLQSGRTLPNEQLKPTHPFTKGLIDRMKQHLMLAEEGNNSAPVTYSRAIRAMALTVHDRPEDRDQLQKDVDWLLKAHWDGAYTYKERIGNLDRIKREREMDEKLRNRGVQFYFDPLEKSRTILFDNGEIRGGLYGIPIRPRLGSYRPRDYPDPAGLQWDNSNTHYALLGIWSAAEVGLEIPTEYWLAAERHWYNNQLPTGEWDYNGTSNTGTFAMTTGAISALFITHDYLDAPILGADVGRDPFGPALSAGLAWLEKGDNAVRVLDAKVQYMGYNLFNLERIGLTSGLKYLGSHDWYRELADFLLTRQHPNGAWAAADNGKEAIIDTAYALLFLSRGRHPVLMNKLRYDGHWNNRARDLDNLTKFASRETERQLNWQIVNLNRPWHDWLNSPILYIAGHQAPKFKPEDYEKLRAFADAGGLIFTHADASSSSFNTAVNELVRKTFPDSELLPVPQDHELFSVQYRLTKKPKLQQVTNGIRPLLIHSPQDLSSAWQTRAWQSRRDAFEFAVNLFMYATGKSDLRNRLASPYIPPVSDPAAHSIKLARLKYAGQWDPEPYACTRFSNYFKRIAGHDLTLLTTDLKDLQSTTAPIATLTGSVARTFTDDEAAALRRYVDAGGTLLIDSAGGSPAFSQNISDLLTRAFPTTKLSPLNSDHPILLPSTPGMEDLSKPRLRPYTEKSFPKNSPPFQLLSSGKGTVIMTPLDLTHGLLATHTWSISGLHPDHAQAFLKNLIIWASSR